MDECFSKNVLENSLLFSLWKSLLKIIDEVMNQIGQLSVMEKIVSLIIVSTES